MTSRGRKQRSETPFGPPLIVAGQTKFTIPGDFADIDESEYFVASFRT